MKIYTGREFRFMYIGTNPYDDRSEYGAMIKTSFEIQTGYMHSDPGYYDDTASYINAGINYGGPKFSRADSPLVDTPIIKFNYFGVMVSPNARNPRPTSQLKNTSTANNDGRVRWRWSVGYSQYPYFSDVVMADSGAININAPDPSHQGTGAPIVAGNVGTGNGLLYYVSGSLNHWMLGTGSGIWPPVDSHNQLRRISDNAIQDWDGYSLMSLYLNVTTVSADIWISPGFYRFVHLFSEMC